MTRSKKRKTNHQSSNNNVELSHEEIWDDSALIRSWNDAVAEYELYHSIHAKGEDVDEVLRRYEEEQQRQQQNAIQLQPQNQDEIKIQSYANPNPIKSADDSANIDIDIEDGEVDEDSPDVETVATITINDPIAGPTDVQAVANTNAIPIDRDTHTAAKGAEPMSANPDQAVSTTTETETIPQNTTSTLNSVPASTSQPQTQTQFQSQSQSQSQTLESLKMAYYWAGYYSALYDGQIQPQNKEPSQ